MHIEILKPCAPEPKVVCATAAMDAGIKLELEYDMPGVLRLHKRRTGLEGDGKERERGEMGKEVVGPQRWLCSPAAVAAPKLATVGRGPYARHRRSRCGDPDVTATTLWRSVCNKLVIAAERIAIAA